MIRHPRLVVPVAAVIVGLLHGRSDISAETPEDAKVFVSVSEFGTTPKGDIVEVYTMTNPHGMVARVITYGATLVALEVPGRDGETDNVVLGYDSLADYLADTSYFGSTVGRYANRIAQGRFTLDGRDYELPTNNPPNHLHGGPGGMHQRIWSATPSAQGEWASVKLTCTSADGDQGYPGTLQATVTYTLTNSNDLRLDYEAVTDKPTHCNLTNHSYFNLAGHDSGDCLQQILKLHCDRFLPTDSTLIPTGVINPVHGTPMDFIKPKAIGADIGKEEGLYDLCYVCPAEGEGARLVARATDETSGRVLEVLTTEPGIQLYTANHLDNIHGTGGATYNKHQAFCLETQRFPDTPNRSNFPTSVLRPGETYRSTTIYRFSATQSGG